MRRTYYLYDRNRSGKISKEEMLDAMLDLGKIPKTDTDEKGKPKIPDEVENLFSLMDFANDNRCVTLQIPNSSPKLPTYFFIKLN